MKALLFAMLGFALGVCAEKADTKLDYRIVITGGEMLHGVYADAHTHFLTRTLHPLGVHCIGSMIVDDVREQMLAALRFATNDVSLVIVTGGLGPTPNDITRETLAEFTGIALREHPEVLENIARRMKQPKEQLRPNLRKQAMVPVRGGYLKTEQGTAAGLIFELDSVVIVALPGPPRELQPMVTNELLPYLRRKFGVRPLGATLKLRFVGIGQSQISHTIKEHVAVPSDVVITSLFEGGRVDFSFSLPPGRLEAEVALRRLKEQILEKLGEYCYAEGNLSLEEVVLGRLKMAGFKLVLAEVATGGQLAARLNGLPDAPSVLVGAYAAPTEAILAQLLQADVAGGPESLAAAAARRTGASLALAVGQPQQTADGRFALAALNLPGGGVKTQRLGVRGSDDDARAQLVTQLLDFLRRQLR
ncbi:MAG: molybdopterin-binding protein [Verrucomicrobiae bacterium]|nr:molybdopterin-binding protein [Verrucomicrobiae bacterium]